MLASFVSLLRERIRRMEARGDLIDLPEYWSLLKRGEAILYKPELWSKEMKAQVEKEFKQVLGVRWP